jgi:mRNA-degrading endonuclease RelE of RelBE toxin-antitoxin system
MAKVIVTPQAVRAIEALPLVVHARVISLLDRLELWPAVSGAKPLSGKLAGRYRLRTGDYRVQFRVQGDTIAVEKVGHRDRFYD